MNFCETWHNRTWTCKPVKRQQKRMTDKKLTKKDFSLEFTLPRTIVHLFAGKFGWQFSFKNCYLCLCSSNTLISNLAKICSIAVLLSLLGGKFSWLGQIAGQKAKCWSLCWRHRYNRCLLLYSKKVKNTKWNSFELTRFRIKHDD